MRFKQLYKLLIEQDNFKLEAPESNKWYKTFDPFFPDANKREHEDVPEYEEYDDWTDYIYMESSIERDHLEEFVKYFKLQEMSYLEDNFINLKDNKNSYWLRYDPNSEIYDIVAKSDESLENEIQSIDDHDKLTLMGLSEDDLYINGWECSIRDVKEYGGTVYHYTTEERWEEIEESKELRTSYGTGLTNQGANGIFASMSPDTNADGIYGDVLLEIDLAAYKQRYKIDKLDVSPEPDVLDAAINMQFASALGIENYEEQVSSDMSEDTIIVGHVIPLKFIKRLEN
jgi:hypothetical protein